MTGSFASVAGPDGQPLDQIRITGISGRGRHGVLESERATGQEFRADVVLHLDARAAAEGDDLRATVSYADVAREVHDVLVGEPVDLIETLAERIAATALAHEPVRTVDVTVHKPQAPIPVAFDDVEVSIRRDRVAVPPAVGSGTAAVVDEPGPAGQGVASGPAGAAEEHLATSVGATSGPVGGGALDDPLTAPEPPADDATRVVADGLVVPEIAPVEETPVAPAEPVPAAEPALAVPAPAVPAEQAAPAFEPRADAPARPEEDESTARRPAYDPTSHPAAAFVAGAASGLAAADHGGDAPAESGGTGFGAPEQSVPEQSVLGAEAPAGDQGPAVEPYQPEFLPEQHGYRTGQFPAESYPAERTSPEQAGQDPFGTGAPAGQGLAEPAFEQTGYDRNGAARNGFDQSGYDQGGAAQNGSLQNAYEQAPIDQAPIDQAPIDQAPIDTAQPAAFAEQPGQAAYPEQAGYPEQSGDTEQPGYPEQPAYSDQPAYPGQQPAPGEQPAPAAGVAHGGSVPSDRLDEVPAGQVEVVLALGANLGDPQATLRAAVMDLDRIAGLRITDVSPLARTAAVGGPEQPDYLNAVVVARTSLSPRGLLRACQAVEHAHGRTREEHWGPRTLDIDLITYGLLTAAADDLEVPHPRAHERAFVLEPWSQLKPDAVLPGLGGGPVAQLAATAGDRQGIRWLALDWLTESHSGADPTGDVEPQPTASHRPYNPPAAPAAPEQPAAGQFQQPQQPGPTTPPQGFAPDAAPHGGTPAAAVPPPEEAMVPAPSTTVADPQTSAPVVPQAVRETAHQEVTGDPFPAEPTPPAQPVFAPVRPQPGDVPFAPVHPPAVEQQQTDGDEPRPAWAPVRPEENGQRG